MTIPTNGWRALTIPSDSVGNAVAVIFDAVNGVYRLAVDAVIGGGVIVTVATERLGDEAAQVMTPALPTAGAQALTPEIDMQEMEDIIVSVFADQPWDVTIRESYAAAGTKRESGVLFSGTASLLRGEMLNPSRRFFQIGVRNTGLATMTILECTVTRRR